MMCRTHSSGRIFALFQLLSMILISLAGGNDLHLTTNELRDKYGQANTTFNDGRSCYRVCDGKQMSCYYEFLVQNHEVMSKLCGACADGKINDCLQNGCVTANGVTEKNGVRRQIMTVNQQMPGPTINVCKGDRVIVDVLNQMDGEELSFHWHGLQQKESPWFDGVPMVTQCPISPGKSFRYMFNVDTGSHYYQAHSGLQQSNGLIGKIDVRDQEDPNADYYDFDLDEHSILLTDWSNEPTNEQAPGISNEATVPDSLLINGFGQYFDRELGNYTYAPVAVFYVERSKRHRFRVHNAATHNCPLELSIQAINMTVIATDGSPIEPIVVENFVSSSGERFDVVVHAFNFPEIKQVLMSVRGLLSCAPTRLDGFAKIMFVDDLTNHTANIEDHQPPQERPSYDPPDQARITLNHPHFDCTKSDDICVAALRHKNISSGIGGNLRNESATVIPFTFRLIAGPDPSTLVGSINNITNEPSPVPGLIQDDTDVPYCNVNNLPEYCNATSVCQCPHLVHLELCKVYEFILLDDRRHESLVNYPIHLHGFKFQVIDMGTREQLGSGQSAFVNATHLPVIKDTVIIPGGGFVRFRFRSCNPGYWFFRGHFGIQAMTATIRVGNRSDLPPSPPNLPTCRSSMAPAYGNHDN